MDEEYRSVTAILKAYYTFWKYQHECVVKPKTLKYQALAPDEKELLPWFPNLIRDLTQCVEINRNFGQDLAITAARDWGVAEAPENWAQPSAIDYDKVRATFLQVAREWSEDGATERSDTYGRLVNKACELVPPHQRSTCKVLVPGCGLGRLVYEFVKHGFWTQGNEVSYHMLLALGYLLNHVPMAHGHTIFPYIHTLSHVTRRLFQVRPVLIPDESPLSIFGDSQHQFGAVLERMSMTAGSFVDLYGPPGLAQGEEYTQDASAVEFRDQNEAAFDLVATCFFLDTAHNVIEYLKTIRHCLKPGGTWLNVGPLHWHFEGDRSQHTVSRITGEGQEPVTVPSSMEGLELSRDELFDLIERMGFKISNHVPDISTTYSSDTRASSKFVYGCDFWVAERL